MSFELLAFSIPEKHAQRMVDSLNRDFYTTKNVFAIRNPLIVDNNIIVCPLELPVPKLIQKQVLKQIFKGFEKSARKKFVIIKRVKISNELKNKYEGLYKIEFENL